MADSNDNGVSPPTVNQEQAAPRTAGVMGSIASLARQLQNTQLNQTKAKAELTKKYAPSIEQSHDESLQRNTEMVHASQRLNSEMADVRELKAMNPLARKFRGIFDSDYSLRKQEADVQQASSEFEALRMQGELARQRNATINQEYQRELLAIESADDLLVQQFELAQDLLDTREKQTKLFLEETKVAAAQASMQDLYDIAQGRKQDTYISQRVAQDLLLERERAQSQAAIAAATERKAILEELTGSLSREEIATMLDKGIPDNMANAGITEGVLEQEQLTRNKNVLEFEKLSDETLQGKITTNTKLREEATKVLEGISPNTIKAYLAHPENKGKEAVKFVYDGKQFVLPRGAMEDALEKGETKIRVSAKADSERAMQLTDSLQSAVQASQNQQALQQLGYDVNTSLIEHVNQLSKSINFNDPQSITNNPVLQGQIEAVAPRVAKEYDNTVAYFDDLYGKALGQNVANSVLSGRYTPAAAQGIVVSAIHAQTPSDSFGVYKAIHSNFNEVFAEEVIKSMGTDQAIRVGEDGTIKLDEGTKRYGSGSSSGFLIGYNVMNSMGDASQHKALAASAQFVEHGGEAIQRLVTNIRQSSGQTMKEVGLPRATASVLQNLVNSAGELRESVYIGNDGNTVSGYQIAQNLIALEDAMKEDGLLPQDGRIDSYLGDAFFTAPSEGVPSIAQNAEAELAQNPTYKAFHVMLTGQQYVSGVLQAGVGNVVGQLGRIRDGRKQNAMISAGTGLNQNQPFSFGIGQGVSGSLLNQYMKPTGTR